MGIIGYFRLEEQAVSIIDFDDGYKTPIKYWDPTLKKE
jgi:hypothetical protein